MSVKVLTGDELLAHESKPPVAVPVPELGGQVFVREMTAAERDKFDTSLLDDEGNAKESGNYRARLVAATCCDATGKLLFSATQITALGAKSASMIDRIADAAHQLNKLSKRAVEVEKKDSGETPSAGSPTGSP